MRIKTKQITYIEPKAILQMPSKTLPLTLSQKFSIVLIMSTLIYFISGLTV